LVHIVPNHFSVPVSIIINVHSAVSNKNRNFGMSSQYNGGKNCNALDVDMSKY